MDLQGWKELLATATTPAIWVRADEQRLRLYRNAKVVKTYPVSTARAGLGNRENSLQTPLGLHRIWQRIGDGVPPGGILQGRIYRGVIADIEYEPRATGFDFVCTRIMWLEGLEESNSAPGSNSKDRYIYIHGTHEEGLIGQPASHGCVRMYNEDVIELFDQVFVGVPVYISR